MPFSKINEKTKDHHLNNQDTDVIEHLNHYI